MKQQGGRSVPICPGHPQSRAWSSPTMPGVHVQLLGSPVLQRLLFWGAGLPHHDTLSPYWGEPAVPVPPAMGTIISAGRAEASLIIVVTLQDRVLRAWVTAGLSGRAGLWDRLTSRCVDCCVRPGWLPSTTVGTGLGAGCGGEHCHRLRFVLQHALVPPPLPKRHGCGVLPGQTVRARGPGGGGQRKGRGQELKGC